jgi:hypothetical protein
MSVKAPALEYGQLLSMFVKPDAANTDATMGEEALVPPTTIQPVAPADVPP